MNDFYKKIISSSTLPVIKNNSNSEKIDYFSGNYFAKDEAALLCVYFFMQADGKCSEEEIANFEKLIDLDRYVIVDKTEFFNVANKIMPYIESDADNSEIIINAISEVTERSIRHSIFIKGLNSEEKTTLIWNFINIGFSDFDIAESELKIIAYFAKEWNIDDVTIDEMFDTAQTICSLSMHKTNLIESKFPYKKVVSEIETIDNTIIQLFNDMQLTISEITDN